MIGGAVKRSKKKKSPQSKKNYELFLNGDVQKKGRKKSPKRSDIRVIKVNKQEKKEEKKPVKKEEKKPVKKEEKEPEKKEEKKPDKKEEQKPDKKEEKKPDKKEEQKPDKKVEQKPDKKEEQKPDKDVVRKSKQTSPAKQRKLRKSNRHSRSRKKNLKRSSKRVSSKNGLHRKYVNNRKVSLKCVPHNKKKNIDKILNSINTMSNKDIKEKLSKKGITIKSNKQQLLKDMYIFSELGGIKIHKE